LAGWFLAAELVEEIEGAGLVVFDFDCFDGGFWGVLDCDLFDDHDDANSIALNKGRLLLLLGHILGG
jgi:hypothetical protein